MASDYKITGWQTIIGGCKGHNGNKTYTEGVQIAFSPEWELVPNMKQNPLANTLNSDHCFDTGRPYNLAYFQQKNKTDFKVLFVLIHPPHCYDFYTSGNPDDLRACIRNKGYLRKFGNFAFQVFAATGSSAAALKNLNVVIVGDTNELGSRGLTPPGNPVRPMSDCRTDTRWFSRLWPAQGQPDRRQELLQHEQRNQRYVLQQLALAVFFRPCRGQSLGRRAGGDDHRHRCLSAFQRQRRAQGDLRRRLLPGAAMTMGGSLPPILRDARKARSSG